MLLRNGQASQLKMELVIPESINAPVEAGQVVGFVRVLLGETVVAKLNVVAASAVPLPGFIEGFFRIINAWR